MLASLLLYICVVALVIVGIDTLRAAHRSTPSTPCVGAALPRPRPRPRHLDPRCAGPRRYPAHPPSSSPAGETQVVIDLLQSCQRRSRPCRRRACRISPPRSRSANDGTVRSLRAGTRRAVAGPPGFVGLPAESWYLALAMHALMLLFWSTSRQAMLAVVAAARWSSCGRACGWRRAASRQGWPPSVSCSSSPRVPGVSWSRRGGGPARQRWRRGPRWRHRQGLVRAVDRPEPQLPALPHLAAHPMGSH